jgi:DNA-binding LytR/AlgR family response regulator
MFMRVHRSHIVRLSAVKSLERDNGKLLVQLEHGGEPVPVSRSSANELLSRLGMPAATPAPSRKSTAG